MKVIMAQEFEHLQTDQDVDEILRLAVQRSGGSTDLRARMAASAEELGITPEELAAAEEEYRTRRQEEVQEKAARIKRRRAFIDHLATYFCVNLGLVAIWYFSGRDYFWPIWPLTGWGLFGVLPHFWNAWVMNRDEEKDEDEDE